MNQTAIAHYAEAAELTNHRDMETSYFHLGKAEPPFGIGTPRQPPPEARVWSPQDWFALPSGRLFPAYAGDFQPRDTDGDVLQTAERLSIQAMRGQTGRTAGRSLERDRRTRPWTAATGSDPDRTPPPR